MLDNSLTITVNNEKTTLTISINGANAISLDAISLSEFIQLLSKIRVDLKPQEIADIPNQNKKVLTSPLSRFYIEPLTDQPGSIVIAMFHPGPGWIGLVLDHDKAGHLRDMVEYTAKLTPTH